MQAGKPRVGAHEKGITYLWMLFLVFLLGIGLGKAMEIQSLVSQRSKEADLLYVGGLYREAIKAYYLSTVDGIYRYPASLDVLLKDSRYPVPKRYIRKLYPDPVTGKPFELIHAPEGGIAGVRSSSIKQPIKKAGFSQEYEVFNAAVSYRDWVFRYEGEQRTSSVRKFR